MTEGQPNPHEPTSVETPGSAAADDRRPPPPRRPTTRQDNPFAVQRVDRGQYEAADVTAYLLAGPITFGGLGWWADQSLSTGFLVPVGALVGLGVALYVVYVKYSKV